jgi:hypothetical protein
VSPAGSSDTLAASEVVVEVASVLPANRPKSELAPRDPAPLLPQSARSLLPVAVFLVLVGVAALAGWWWWRAAEQRRRRHRTAPVTMSEPSLDAVLDGWEAAGELRAALDGWSQLVQRRAGSEADPARREAAQSLLAEIAAAGFRPDPSPAEAEALIERARAVAGSA